MRSISRKISGTQAIQIFQVARYGALMLSSILLTKSSLRQSDIGHYETFLLVAGSMSFFWINGILNSFLSVFHKFEDKKAVISAAAILLGGISCFIIIILFFFRNSITGFFQFYGDNRLYALLLLYFLFNSFSFLLDYILFIRNNIKGLFWLSGFHLLFQVALIAGPAYLYKSYESVVSGLIIFVAIKFCITLFVVLKNISFRPDREIFKAFIKTGSPLIISFFLGGISIYVDGIIVNHYYDKATFAVYMYGAREFPLSLLLANAFSAAMAVKISQDNANIISAKTGSLQLMNRLFPVCILLLIISKWLYPVVFNPGFSAGYIYFNIYMLLLIPRLVFPHSILTGMGKTNWIMFASMLEFILNIVISLSLNAWIGLQGVAYGTVIAFLLNKGLLTWRLHKQGIAVRDFIPIRQFSIYSSALILIFVIFTYCI